MVQTKTMADLFADLEALMVEHAKAERECQEADKRMTDIRNRLNATQKAIDDGVAATRKIAPWSTDWHSRNNPGVKVSA